MATEKEKQIVLGCIVNREDALKFMNKTKGHTDKAINALIRLVIDGQIEFETQKDLITGVVVHGSSETVERRLH